MKHIFGSLWIAGFAACAGAGDEQKDVLADAAQVSAEPVRMEDRLPDLRSASCPEGLPVISPEALRIRAEPLSLGGDEADALTGASFTGAWHLTADDANFGGLSGLKVLPSGDLLTVSDAGAFIWIGMEDGTPSGTGRLGYMRGTAGDLLAGKRNGDAEGLDYLAGTALVSFERNHRVLAFDLERCGENARGALITEISDRPDGLPRSIEENRGAEALMVDGQGWLVAGLETSRAGPVEAPVSTLTDQGMTFADRISRPEGAFLVGLDAEGDGIFGLFRSYAPAVGNLIEVRSYDSLSDQGTTRIRLSRPFTVDNFEGISAMPLDDGGTRIFLISDDNFSARQRTLLMAFDLTNE
ncbi:MAG: esterase-like activity of phytase family protein [Pseudomonadota bacterium]